jgi:hypothetical protein
MNRVVAIIIATAMPRCLHVHDSGFQCVSEALDSSDFCEDHQKIVPFEVPEETSWQKVFLRFVALILLIMFLVPIIYTLRNLYVGPPAEAQEVW